ncbi:MAG: hypothetical protein HC892_22680 [Saprospiraceae bacterium]|nr:hypothetical protein [Saprospiraceae bacterium]
MMQLHRLKLALANNKNTYIVDSLGLNFSGVQGGFVVFGSRLDSVYSQIGQDFRTSFTGLIIRSPRPVILKLGTYLYVISLTINDFPSDNRFVHFWSGNKYQRLDSSEAFFIDNNTLVAEVPAFVRSEMDRLGWVCVSFGSL